MTGPSGIDDGRVAVFGRGLDHEFGHTDLKGERVQSPGSGGSKLNLVAFVAHSCVMCGKIEL